MGRIGAPVTEPALVHVRLATRDGAPVAQFQRRVAEIAGTHLGRTSELVDDFIAGQDRGLLTQRGSAILDEQNAASSLAWPEPYRVWTQSGSMTGSAYQVHLGVNA